jgi:hypothetical protein
MCLQEFAIDFLSFKCSCMSIANLVLEVDNEALLRVLANKPNCD